MNRERLEIQIDILRHVKVRNFDMTAWLRRDDARTIAEEEPCKTAACAFGYAGLDPRMQAEGLSLRIFVKGKEHIINTIADYNAMMASIDYRPIVNPVYQGLESFNAAMKFYDIDSDIVDFLFEPSSYNFDRILPSHVIERIEDIMGEQTLYKEWREDGV